MPFGPGRPGVVATQRLRIGAVQDGEPGRLVQPAVRLCGELGVDRQPGCQHQPTGLGRDPQRVDGGPGAFGVHVVDRDRGDPAPVVDARVQQVAEPVEVGEVRWGLDVHVGRQHQPGQRDRPHMGLGRAGRVVAHRGARFGQEVLHDHLLHVTVPSVRCGDRLQGGQPVGLRLADAHQDPGGERDAQLPGPLQGRQPAFRGLVRGTSVRGQVGTQRLDHHPLRRRDGPESGQVLTGDRAGVRVGQQTGLLQHPPRHRHQVVDRRGVPVGGQPVACFDVPVLRGLTEGEQHLVTPRLRARRRDRHHLVRRQERRGDVVRCRRERAVPTPVPTQPRQRHEHLRRVRHPRPRRGAAHPARHRRQLVGREIEQRHGQCHDAQPYWRCFSRWVGGSRGGHTTRPPGAAWSRRSCGRRCGCRS